MSFPLPLTTMEEFLYWEDRPAYPWSCFVRLRFSGCLDRAAFESAVYTLLKRHVLFASRVEKDNRGSLQWKLVNDPTPTIKWETAPVGGALPPATHLDLHREIGIRFHIRTNENESDVTIQFHHACCDGAGIALFIKELLVIYALTIGNAPSRARLSELDSGKLKGRGRFGLTPWKLLRMAPKQMVGILGARQFLMRKPVPVIPHHVSANYGPLPKQYPATMHYLFDLESTAALRKAAMRQGVTSNDLLARDLFLALAQWRRRNNIEDNGDWLRMMIPMNLRNNDDRFLPAANVVSSVFLDRRGPDFADPNKLLRSIHDEMELIKRLQLGYTFIFSTAICRKILGGLEKQVRADKCTISCILTNLGNFLAHVPLSRQDDRLVAGNVILEDLDIVAPVRPYSCVTFAATLYARKLGITLHYDPRPVTDAQAADLLEIYVRRIHASIAESDAHSECLLSTCADSAA